MPVLAILLATAVLAGAGLSWWLFRDGRPSELDAAASTEASAPVECRPEFPEAGLLVPDEVLRISDSSPGGIWGALESAAVPVAVEYFPVSDVDMTKYRTVPINAAAQQSMVDIVKALDPNSATLYRVVLPKGLELVRAAGTSGFRGFARSGGRIAGQAVLKPVAAGGALLAGWPVFAVAGTVMAVDMAAQRELRAHQRRVETILGRQEERYYVDRIKDQRSADAQLTRAISLVLDGRTPRLEVALKSAYDEFHRAQQFLEKYRGVVARLVDTDGKVDHRKLDEALGGKTKDVGYFLRELHLARGAIAIRRKALLADAASAALGDPSNPYAALRRFLDAQIHQLECADGAMEALTNTLSEVELKGGWSVPKVVAKQERFRERVKAPKLNDEVDLRFLRTASGEIVQVVEIEDEQRDDVAPAEEPLNARSDQQVPEKSEDEALPEGDTDGRTTSSTESKRD